MRTPRLEHGAAQPVGERDRVEHAARIAVPDGAEHAWRWIWRRAATASSATASPPKRRMSATSSSISSTWYGSVASQSTPLAS